MTEVNKNKVRTDEAWRHLYTRLDKDILDLSDPVLQITKSGGFNVMFRSFHLLNRRFVLSTIGEKRGSSF